MKTQIAVLEVGLLLLAGLAGSGCNDMSVEPANQNPEVTPSSAQISKGQSIEFTASKGYEFQWRLEHEDWGILSARTGDKTVYTSTHDPAAGAVDSQVLTVDSTITGTSGPSGSNGQSYVTSTDVFISHMGLSISPSSVTQLGVGQSIVFTASGGTQYTWGLLHPDWGVLSTASGQTTTYTSTFSAGTNVTVTQVLTVHSFDSAASASISQQ